MPSTLSARARLLATGGDRKTDAADALHVAQVALFRDDLRTVVPEDQCTILRLLTERHDDLVHERTRVLNRLHAVLRDLLPGGVPTGLSADKAAAAMKCIRPATATDACRRDIARDLLGDLRRLDRQVKDNEAEMLDALAAAHITLTTLPGLAPCWPPSHRPRRRHHSLPHRAPLRQLHRQRTPGRLQRQQRPSSAQHRRQPRPELRAARHRRLPDPRRRPRTGLLPAQDRGRKDPSGGSQGPQTPPVQRGLLDHETRPTEPPRSGRLTHRGAIRSQSPGRPRAKWRRPAGRQFQQRTT